MGKGGGLVRRSVAALILAAVVLAFGGMVIASEPPDSSPVPPDDLSVLMPQELGGIPLTVRVLTGPGALADSAGTEAIADVLTALGKTADDLRIAQAFAADLTTTPAYAINAFRVDGVEGRVLLESMWMRTAEDAGLPPDFPLPLETIGGRTVWPVYRGPDNQWIVIYASGEMLVNAIGAGGLPLEEAMPLLP